jgi:Ala-tRNA(Pro) deacylase
MSETILSAIRRRLTEAGVEFREVEHEPTYTSAESAAARGEELGVGAKALLLQADGTFCLFVVPADQRLDSRAVKRELGVKRLRFATADELRELTGLVPGAVPPFGEPILPFALYADTSVGARSNKVAFNAGSLTVSIIMAASDWEAVAQPRRFRCAESAEQENP